MLNVKTLRIGGWVRIILIISIMCLTAGTIFGEEKVQLPNSGSYISTGETADRKYRYNDGPLMMIEFNSNNIEAIKVSMDTNGDNELNKHETNLYEGFVLNIKEGSVLKWNSGKYTNYFYYENAISEYVMMISSPDGVIFLLFKPY